MNGAKVRLGLALAAFLGWLGYLGYTALSRSQEPRVSQAALAAAKIAVVADLVSDHEGKLGAKVKGTTLGDSKPFEGTVANLNQVRGYSGAGKYLLLLEPDGPDHRLVTLPRSPGHDRSRLDATTIYPWSPGVQAQLAKWKP